MAVHPAVARRPTRPRLGNANYETFLLPWAPLYLAAFITANTAALRERETTTAEMFRSTPTRCRERTLALLAAGLIPITLATVLAAIHLSVIAQTGGITVGNQAVKLTPTVAEMALVPATTAAAFASGVALARTVRSRTVGVVFGAITTWLTLMFWVFAWFPAYFLAPYTTSLRSVGLGQDLTVDELTNLQTVNAPSYHEEARWQVLVRDTQLVGWHNLYLIGLALLLAAYAVRRSGRLRRARWLLLPGAMLAMGGLARHMAAMGGPFAWWDLVHGLEGL
jgi:hypothetical protein